MNLHPAFSSSSTCPGLDASQTLPWARTTFILVLLCWLSRPASSLGQAPSVQPPGTCRHSVLRSCEADSEEVVPFVSLGDSVCHRFRCHIDTSRWCMSIQQCKAFSFGGPPTVFVDSAGCSADPARWPHPRYPNNSTAELSMRIDGELRPSSLLHFFCQVRLTPRGRGRCSPPTCPEETTPTGPPSEGQSEGTSSSSPAPEVSLPPEPPRDPKILRPVILRSRRSASKHRTVGLEYSLRILV